MAVQKIDASVRPAVTVNQLRKEYPGVVAVNNISFQVMPGICFGLLGPNGAGKTTTLEIMEGIHPASSGTVHFFGDQLFHQFRDRIGIQFQHTALQEFLTVRETLNLFRRLSRRSTNVDELIRLCSLDEYLDRDTAKLSGGQRQRLLLALALVNDPEIVFLDEPTTGLDPQARRNFWELIQRIKKQGKTILLTTHYMDEAYVLCDEIAIMDKGQIISQGSPEYLLKNHYGETIIVLPNEDIQPSLSQLGVHYFQQQNTVEIPTHDLDATLKRLIELGVPLQQLKIRSWNLEDLFIALTGKTLRQ